MGEAVGRKVAVLLVVTVVAAVIAAVLTAEEVAVRRQEVDWVLHAAVQSVGAVAELAVALHLLRLLLLSLAAAAADELTEGQRPNGVDVVAGGGGGQLLQRTAAAGAVGVGAGAGGVCGRVDDRAEHLTEARVEADALAADQLAQRTGQFDARVLRGAVTAAGEAKLAVDRRMDREQDTEKK